MNKAKSKDLLIFSIIKDNRFLLKKEGGDGDVDYFTASPIYIDERRVKT
jgi:hypothetical protein